MIEMILTTMSFVPSFRMSNIVSFFLDIISN